MHKHLLVYLCSLWDQIAIYPLDPNRYRIMVDVFQNLCTKADHARSAAGSERSLCSDTLSAHVLRKWGDMRYRSSASAPLRSYAHFEAGLSLLEFSAHCPEESARTLRHTKSIKYSLRATLASLP